ncbi:MAG: hypothetical protein A2158_08135, partial [Chloroflexi bacterium RBG_13_46_14]
MSSHYKDTFKGTAWYYARYREGYPEEFFELLRSKFSLSGDDRILDHGCGTGQIAIPLAGSVKEVVAMDPEPEMIAEGREQAALSGVKNITWINSGSEDLPSLREKLGEFNLVTIGTAFHWMDRKKTLNDLYGMITRNGGIVVAGNNSIWTEHPYEWQTVIKDLIKKYLGEERRAGSGVFKSPGSRHEEVIKESLFKHMETWKYLWTRISTLDEVIGNLYSTSMANPTVLGEKKEAFESE